MQKYTITFLFYLCIVLLACFKKKGQCDAEQRCLYLSKKLTNQPKYVTLTLESLCKLPHPTIFTIKNPKHHPIFTYSSYLQLNRAEIHLNISMCRQVIAYTQSKHVFHAFTQNSALFIKMCGSC